MTTEEPTIKQIKSEELTEQEQKIVDYIKQYGSIRRIVVEDILELKTSRAAELLSKMVNKGIIKKTGNNKDVKYIL